MATDLSVHMPAVAQAILGDPNWGLSKIGQELRYGTNGSLSIDIEKGTWFDHSESVGGGVLDFIKVRKGLDGAAAFDYLREIGCEVEAPRRNGVANGHHPPAEKKPEGKRVVEATYDYRDEAGALVFQVVRCAFQLPDGSFVKTADGKKRKAIFQRRPDGTGGWVNKLDAVRVIPYRLAELIEAIADDRPIYIVEGEKKADALWKIGVASTTAPMGAGKWPAHFAPYFEGARVVILPDNDEPGRRHADQVAANIADVAASVLVLELPDLPPKGDVVDWLAEGGTAAELAELAAGARVWEPRARSAAGCAVGGSARRAARDPASATLPPRSLRRREALGAPALSGPRPDPAHRSGGDLGTAEMRQVVLDLGSPVSRRARLDVPRPKGRAGRRGLRHPRG
jgi:hypothetical protein